MSGEARLGTPDVKVGQDDLKALVLLAQEIGHRNLDVVEGDVGGPGGGRVASLDGLRLDTLAPFDQQDAEPFVGADAGGKVIGKGAISDPFLGSIDNVMLAVGSLRRLAP